MLCPTLSLFLTCHLFLSVSYYSSCYISIYFLFSVYHKQNVTPTKGLCAPRCCIPGAWVYGRHSLSSWRNKWRRGGAQMYLWEALVNEGGCGTYGICMWNDWRPCPLGSSWWLYWIKEDIPKEGPPWGKGLVSQSWLDVHGSGDYVCFVGIVPAYTISPSSVFGSTSWFSGFCLTGW